MIELTEKQRKFVEAYVKCGVASEAARQAGYSEKTVRSHTGKIMESPAVKKVLAQLRAEAMAKAEISLISLLEELEEARLLALENKSPAPAVSASMGKAKLLGLDKPKEEKIVEDDSADAEPKQVLVKFV